MRKNCKPIKATFAPKYLRYSYLVKVIEGQYQYYSRLHISDQEKFPKLLHFHLQKGLEIQLI